MTSRGPLVYNNTDENQIQSILPKNILFYIPVRFNLIGGYIN